MAAVGGGGGCNVLWKGLLDPEVSPPAPAPTVLLGGMNSRMPDMLSFFKVLGSNPRLLRSVANCDMEPAAAFDPLKVAAGLVGPVGGGRPPPPPRDM